MAAPYSRWFDVWSATSSRWAESVAALNRAAWSAVAAGDRYGTDPDAEDRIDPDADLAEWAVERDVASPAELAVGDVVRFTKSLTAADVERFAAASGDTNPLHLDDEWAEATRFDGRIVHGTLVSGLISAALARLPGNVVYLSQRVEFRAPVRVGDAVTAAVEVVEDLGDDRYRLRTTVEADETAAVEGEAVVLVCEAPDA